jgi:hypothetical protein
MNHLAQFVLVANCPDRTIRLLPLQVDRFHRGLGVGICIARDGNSLEEVGRIRSWGWGLVV